MTRANKHIGSATEMMNQREHLIELSITEVVIDLRASLKIDIVDETLLKRIGKRDLSICNASEESP
jgi:hypothetical protein